MTLALRLATVAAIALIAIWPGATLMSLALSLLRGESAMFRDRWIAAGLFLRLVLVEGVAGIVIGLGCLLFIAPGLYVVVVWSQVRALMVDGRASFFDALEESQDLTRGSRGEVFVTVLGVLALVAASLGCVELTRWATGTTPDSWALLLIRLAFQGPVSAFATAAAAALYLALVAAAAPLTQSGYFLAPASSPS